MPRLKGAKTRLLQRGAHEDATIILELEADEVTWTIALAVEGDGCERLSDGAGHAGW